jgi:hypothetical protein
MISRTLTVLVAVTLTLPATATAQGAPDATCPGPAQLTNITSNPFRFAQTFRVQNSGGLVQAQVLVEHESGPGDYLMQINALDPSGVPTNSVLASVVVPGTAVAESPDAFVSGEFTPPLEVDAGEMYAIVLSRPGGTIGGKFREDCPGQAYESPTADGAFTAKQIPMLGPADMIFSTFVDSTAPETTITTGPKDKTRKRTASFEFTSDDPGASFLCAVDDQVLKVPCTSPYTVRVKRGKHSFRVVATDEAGNADATPAGDDWKVKRKKKRKR